jgi:hypothetical protein
MAEKPDRLSDVRATLKDGVRSQQQARKLARVAAAALNPDADEMRERLERSFGEIPIAEQFRGESAAARDHAVKMLDEAENLSKKRRKRSSAAKP